MFAVSSHQGVNFSYYYQIFVRMSTKVWYQVLCENETYQILDFFSRAR